MSFSLLGLDQRLVSGITALGYREPTPIQKEAIPVILAGHDVMAGAQTGTGKTAAFALPILQSLMARVDRDPDPSERHVAGLVLVPTRELAQQVHQSFEQYAVDCPVRVAIAYGGVSLNPQIKKMKAGADIVIATPGRLLDLLYKGALDLSSLNYLVFDEADRMLDMGFIDEIKRILKHVPKQRQTLLFSATFDDAIFSLSKTLLRSPKLIEVDARNTAAIDVEQMVVEVDEDRKRELVSHLIGSKNWHQVLIFTRTKQGADILASEMCKDGVNTLAIHGDKSQGARERGLEEFISGKVRALVATDVAARGLDIENLNYVINYELPHIPEDYIHRIGRTGRAGNTGLAISLLSAEERWMLEEIEVILDTKLPTQWLPGYEPDLTKEVVVSRKNSRAAQKKRAKQRAQGKRTGNRRR